jgi:hypothetical protein
MIDRRFNPACRRNLGYLQDRRVVRVVRERTKTSPSTLLALRAVL